MNKSTNQTHNIYRKTVREWLSMPYKWRIPVYQRHYAWDAEEDFGPTQSFWEVVEEQAKKRLLAKSPGDKQPHPHYFGAILVENKPEPLSSVQLYDVVDGQQRLTTLNVVLFSLIGLAAQKGHKKKVKDELAEYIFSDPSPDKRKNPKLVPTNFDKDQYENLLYHVYDESKPKKRNRSEQYDKSMVVRACRFFNLCFERFAENNHKEDIEILIKVLQDTILDGFAFVVIPLEETDEAQKVFEALNNTSQPLTTFDLIRNNIFYRADKEERGLDEKLFKSETWQQFEVPFWEEFTNKKGGDKHIEVYIARMLVAKQEEFILFKSIYRSYKDFANNNPNIMGVEQEIDFISEYVDVYKYLVGETNKNPVSKNFDFGYFKSHHLLTTVFLPVIFIIATCESIPEEKQRMIKLLESWYMRRSVCNLMGDYNKQAPKLCKKLGSKPNYSKLDDFLKESDDDTRTFPRTERVESILYGLNFYARKKIAKHVFENIVWHTTSETRNERRDIKGLTIDHIIPQSWEESEDWRNVLSAYDEGTITTKIHTIGNLTPMSRGTNSGKSNLPWIIENGKGARCWLKESDLQMTRDLAEEKSWTIKDIDERTKKLAKIICEIWPYDIV